jgi:hypothetical protein
MQVSGLVLGCLKMYNKLFKSDSQRVALLLCVVFGV